MGIGVGKICYSLKFYNYYVMGKALSGELCCKQSSRQILLKYPPVKLGENKILLLFTKVLEIYYPAMLKLVVLFIVSLVSCLHALH